MDVAAGDGVPGRGDGVVGRIGEDGGLAEVLAGRVEGGEAGGFYVGGDGSLVLGDEDEGERRVVGGVAVENAEEGLWWGEEGGIQAEGGKWSGWHGGTRVGVEGTGEVARRWESNNKKWL